jgi:hypothetical protein
MSTHFHPSINFSFSPLYNQPGPSMVAIPQGFPVAAPIARYHGSVPWPTDLEDIETSWQNIPDGSLDTFSQQLFF